MTRNIKTIGAGRSLFKQGDKSGDLYFIQEGSIELSVRDSKSGHEDVIATLGPKSVLGTMSFLEGEPRSASATTKSELKCVVINQTQRDRLLKTIPTWLQVLIKDLSKNLRRANQNYVGLLAKYDRLKKKYEAKTGQILEDEPNEDSPPSLAEAPLDEAKLDEAKLDEAKQEENPVAEEGAQKDLRSEQSLP
ncbi:MAG: cyclic nucleotide-binding domain-containing protein [Deltaproteobacteria bacterium]|nr:cyclic nucleotide-binding domain-containing protein [Deltaproteobacteria bacterium]